MEKYRKTTITRQIRYYQATKKRNKKHTHCDPYLSRLRTGNEVTPQIIIIITTTTTTTTISIEGGGGATVAIE